jgi:hypothetical protein
MPDAQERHGRLHLWIMALTECANLLRNAERARLARDSKAPPPTELDEEYLSLPFGTWWDLNEVFHNNVLLAIVLICQLFTTGNKDAGSVAANAALADELRFLVATAFPSLSDRERFDALIRHLKYIRHKNIAHADGAAFGVSHGDTIVSSSSFRSAMHSVDLPFFTEAVERLRREAANTINGEGRMYGWIG